MQSSVKNSDFVKKARKITVPCGKEFFTTHDSLPRIIRMHHRICKECRDAGIKKDSLSGVIEWFDETPDLTLTIRKKLNAGTLFE